MAGVARGLHLEVFLFVSLQGEYGLAEAVAEIKDWKVKVNVRDR